MPWGLDTSGSQQGWQRPFRGSGEFLPSGGCRALAARAETDQSCHSATSHLGTGHSLHQLEGWPETARDKRGGRRRFFFLSKSSNRCPREPLHLLLSVNRPSWGLLARRLVMMVGNDWEMMLSSTGPNARTRQHSHGAGCATSPQAMEVTEVGREQAVVGESDGSPIAPSSIAAAGSGHANSRLPTSRIFPATTHVTVVSWQVEGSTHSMVPGLQHRSGACPRASSIFSVHRQHL